MLVYYLNYFNLCYNTITQNLIYFHVDETIQRRQIFIALKFHRLKFIRINITACVQPFSTSVVPVGLPHCTSKPVELGGYLLPENTMIMANVSESMTGDRYWHRGLEFSPERWLESGWSGCPRWRLKDSLPRSFMPFGVGWCDPSFQRTSNRRSLAINM